VRLAIAAALLFVAANSVVASGGAQDSLQSIKVADGVFAILQPFDNRFNDSNSVLIVGPTSAIVVDSQMGPESARAVIAEIRKLTNKPVRQVIATHWHGDHFQGNEAYREAWPGVEFVAHTSAADEMRTRATKARDDDVARLRKELPAAEERLAKGIDRQGKPVDAEGRRLLSESITRNRRYLAALESVTFVFPTATIGEQATWHVGDREVRLMHFRGHTAGDIAIFLPEERVLVTGDLVDDMPFLGHGFPSEYLRTLDTLAALDWDTLVPGHGQVRKGKGHLRAVAAVFGAVYADVKQAVADGLTLEQTRARVDLAPHKPKLTYGDARAGRAFDGFMVSAIERMYEELKTP
jgi:glyoxylase-like metal-dependent hydrolase (beta-lactamase superfamily II)